MTVDTKHPNHVYEKLFDNWIVWAGPPDRLVCDNGGEFKRELSEELQSIGSVIKTTASLAPTQNAMCERAGGAWKVGARALFDEFSVSIKDIRRMKWLAASNNWAVNSMINETGYSASQWVLGKNLKLPYNMLSQTGRLDFARETR